MNSHIENDEYIFEVFNYGNFTIRTTSGETIKLSSKDFWTQFFYEPDGENLPLTLILYDGQCNEVERHNVTPKNVLGSYIICPKRLLPVLTDESVKNETT